MSATRMLMLVPATMLAFGLSARASTAAQAQGNAAGQEPTAQKTPVRAAKSSGIPECDKYFSMADACIATKKMSKEDQAATELNVSRLRAMLPIAAAPQGRATLVDRCTASLKSAQKDDKYGCYPSADKPAKPNP